MEEGFPDVVAVPAVSRKAESESPPDSKYLGEVDFA